MDINSIVFIFYILIIVSIPLIVFVPLYIFVFRVLRKLNHYLELKIIELECKEDKF